MERSCEKKSYGAQAAASKFTLGLRQLFSCEQSHELVALKQGRAHSILEQLDDTDDSECHEHLINTINASLREHQRAKECNSGVYEPRGTYNKTRELVLELIHQANEELWQAEDSFVQRAMLVFDCVESQFTLEHGGAGEVLLYDLLSCLYLCLKVEGRIFNQPFFQYLFSVTQLSGYRALMQHVAPGQQAIGWSEEIYPALEYEILKKLKFKTELVSCSQVVFELFSGFAFQQNATEKAQARASQLDRIFLRAQLRSYLCVIDYLPSEHSSAALGFACLVSAAQAAPEALRASLLAFAEKVHESTHINKDLIIQLALQIDERVLGVECASKDFQCSASANHSSPGPVDYVSTKASSQWTSTSSSAFFKKTNSVALFDNVEDPFGESPYYGGSCGLIDMLENVQGLVSENRMSPCRSAQPQTGLPLKASGLPKVGLDQKRPASELKIPSNSNYSKKKSSLRHKAEQGRESWRTPHSISKNKNPTRRRSEHNRQHHERGVLNQLEPNLNLQSPAPLSLENGDGDLEVIDLACNEEALI